VFGNTFKGGKVVETLHTTMPKRGLELGDHEHILGVQWGLFFRVNHVVVGI
jgi:hypothetical protein